MRHAVVSLIKTCFNIQHIFCTIWRLLWAKLLILKKSFFLLTVFSVCVSQYLHSRWWWRPSGCSPCQSCGGPAPCLPSGWCWRSRWWQCSAGRMGCLWRPQTHQYVSPLTARAAAPAASPAPPNVCEGKTKRNMVEERSHHKIWSFIVVYKSNQILLTIKS